MRGRDRATTRRALPGLLVASHRRAANAPSEIEGLSGLAMPGPCSWQATLPWSPRRTERRWRDIRHAL